MPKPVTSPEKIKEALARGVEKVYPSSEALEKVLLSGKKIRLYCGFDPSASTLHLGNVIQLRKLAQFQRLGHEVIFLIGDFTGMIGDPTDKSAARKRMTRKEVLKNSKKYKEQAGKFLNFSGSNPAKVLYNSEWSDKLSFLDLIEISSNFTVQQMLARDMFQERLKKGRPIHLHEFLYPIAQAYDSVAMDVDLEIGGVDQVFNMLVGRDLVRIMRDKEKFVLTNKLLIDPSGKKMGKTEGNMITMEDSPENMFGKIMSWPDEGMAPAFELLTDIPMAEIESIEKQMKQGEANPRDIKAELAKEIVAVFYGKTAAEKAGKAFDKVFKERKLPDSIENVIKLSSFPTGGGVRLIDLVSRLTSSKAEAKRLIEQKAVSIDGKTQDKWDVICDISTLKGAVLKAGKRKFARLL